VIGLEGLLSRVRRLGQLARALAKEAGVIGEANDPLFYLERLAYPQPCTTRSPAGGRAGRAGVGGPADQGARGTD
jgi:hypothetical protein